MLSLLCLLFSTYAGLLRAEDAGKTTVITHSSVDQSYLTKSFLRSVFTLRVRSWPDGEPIRIFVLDEDDQVHAAFCREVLGTFPYVLRRTWDRTTFTGTGLIPVKVESVDEMKRRVLGTPGAVGYAPTAGSGANEGSSRPVTQASRLGSLK